MSLLDYKFTQNGLGRVRARYCVLGESQSINMSQATTLDHFSNASRTHMFIRMKYAATVESSNHSAEPDNRPLPQIRS